MRAAVASGGPGRAATGFILVTVALDVLAIGIVIPVLPRLVLEFLGDDSVRAATVYGLFATVWSVMQFVAAPILGSLSDRFGRRPIILFSNLGLGLDYVLMALAPNLAWLFVGRVLSGITSATGAAANAYIADITPPEKRAAAFGLIGAAFGLGFVLGPALGGLLGQVDPRLPFWVAAAFALASTAYGWLILPESLPPERRTPFSWRRANPLGALKLLAGQRELTGLALVTFLYFLAHEVLSSTFVLYTDYRYGWDIATTGLALAGLGLALAIVQGGLVRPFVRRFGERRGLLVGLAFGTAGLLIYGLAPTTALFAIGIPVMAMWGLAGPSAQALMTERVEPTQQGQLQGALTAVRGITRLIGPGLFTFTFAASIADGALWPQPGAPFLLAGGLLALGLLVARATARSR